MTLFLKTSVNVTGYRGTDITLPCAVRNLGPKMVRMALKPSRSLVYWHSS